MKEQGGKDFFIKALIQLLGAFVILPAPALKPTGLGRSSLLEAGY